MMKKNTMKIQRKAMQILLKHRPMKTLLMHHLQMTRISKN